MKRYEIILARESDYASASIKEDEFGEFIKVTELREWLLKRSNLDMKYIEAKHNIDMLYALKNNPIKIRDIVTDGSTRIKVEKISLAKRATTDDVPECLYYGPRVTKRNKLFKSNTYASLTQSELVTPYKA